MKQFLITIIASLTIQTIRHIYNNRKIIVSALNLNSFKELGDMLTDFMTKKITRNDILLWFGQALFICAVVIALHAAKNITQYSVLFITFIVIGGYFTFPRRENA